MHQEPLVLSEVALVVVVVVVVVIEEIMQFGHEQLDVYRVSLEYVAWTYRLAKLGGSQYGVRESWMPYGDYDYDNDDESKFKP